MKGIKLKILAVLSACLMMTSIIFPELAAASTSAQIDTSITRIYGSDRFETAAKIAETGWPGTSDYAILADGMGDNLIDALTAGPLAAKLNAPILLTQGDSLNSFAQQELTRMNVKTVFITITNTSVVNLQHIIDQVKAISTVTNVKTLGGSDSSQTSVNIANELANQGVKVNKVIMVGGSGVDALSIAPIAGAQGIPILYSKGDALSSYVARYLDNLKSDISTTYVIGGTGTVSNAVASQLPGSVERVSGQDRYDTNIQVLKKFSNILKYKNTFLANGNTLVDALAVAPLAAPSGSPILLTSQTLPLASKTYAQASLSPNVVALGGESVVSSSDLAGLSPQQVLDQGGTTQGSTDSSKINLTDSVLKITADNVTLNNTASNKSIYIQGNNASLNNVSTKGAIFIDPGAAGKANLNKVTAANIVVMSGSASNIVLQNVTSDALLVASSSNVSVKTSGVTNISRTTVTSTSNIDNSSGGSFGQITIIGAAQSDPKPSVQFTGTFTQPITVNDTATVVAAADASIANVVAAPDSPSQAVTVQGVFNKVTVNYSCNLTLANNTTVQTVVTNSTANITVPTSSSITKLNTNNQDVTIGGVSTVLSASAVNGTVNIKFSNIDPSWPSSGPTPDMFTVTQSINGGTATPVTVSSVSGNSTDLSLIVPSVEASSISQSVVYSVSYKGGTPVSTSAFSVSANSSSSTLAFSTPTTITQAVVGQYYSYTFSATGGSGYGYTYKLTIPSGAASNYPDGLSLSSTGVLSGYPVGTGTWSSIPVTVTDSYGNSVTSYFNLTAGTTTSGSTLAFSSPTTITQGKVGAYYSYTFSATGGSGYGYTYKLTIPSGAASNYPDGLSLSSTGALSGYPVGTGTWSSIPVTVTDSYGNSVTSYFNLTVGTTTSSSSTLAFTNSANISQATVGQYYSYTFSATGGSGYGYTYKLTIPSGAASNYPDGLILSSTGVLSGYPVGTGTWSSIPVTVTDSYGNSLTSYFNLIVATTTSSSSTLSFTSPLNLSQATVGQYYSYTLSASGGCGYGYTYKLTQPSGATSNYPDGLSLSSIGVLSGYPAGTGTWGSIPITVTDGVGNSKTSYFNLTATTSTGSGGSALAFASPANITQAVVGQYYGYTFSATGGSGYGYTYKLTIPSGASSNYPDGLTLSSNGVLSGNPQATGTWNSIPITVTDSYGNSVTSYFNLTVSTLTSSSSTLAFTSPVNITQGAVGQYYSYTFSATGGSGYGYTYRLTIPSGVASNYPDGLSINSNGVLSGYPLGSGTWSSIPVTVIDGVGNTFTGYFTLTVT